MVKPADRTIFIQEFDGTRIVFDPAALQTQLINCFLVAGLSESSYIAEDIAMAIEFTLLNTSRANSTFGRGEVSSAVVRLLEETGFPDVAVVFRRGGDEVDIAIDAESEPITELLNQHLACPPARTQQVAKQVCKAAQLLGINSASPRLWLELARHYERVASVATTKPPERSRDTLDIQAVGKKELEALLPQEVRKLIDIGVMRVNGISNIFPSLHFFFLMNGFARKFNLIAPATELEIEPLLYQMGTMLEKGRHAIEARLKTREQLPLHLTIPDLTTFVITYLNCDLSHTGKLTEELANILVSSFSREVYKLSIQ